VGRPGSRAVAGYDLHTHTTFSDGTTIEDNVAAAAALGLEGLGITDHDTTAPFERRVRRGRRHRARAGARHRVLGRARGRGSRPRPRLLDRPGRRAAGRELDRLRNERTTAPAAIVERFRARHRRSPSSGCGELAGDAPIGRPHIAAGGRRDRGAADHREVFDRYLADGGPAYVEKHAVDPVGRSSCWSAAGGVAVLAHPGCTAPATATGAPDEVIEAMARRAGRHRGRPPRPHRRAACALPRPGAGARARGHRRLGLPRGRGRTTAARVARPPPRGRALR
jgi:3',5'-nucleoside bisphosphate phosphatase